MAIIKPGSSELEIFHHGSHAQQPSDHTSTDSSAAYYTRDCNGPTPVKHENSGFM